jgi:hypothetical protein
MAAAGPVVGLGRPAVAALKRVGRERLGSVVQPYFTATQEVVERGRTEAHCGRRGRLAVREVLVVVVWSCRQQRAGSRGAIVICV